MTMHRTTARLARGGAALVAALFAFSAGVPAFAQTPDPARGVVTVDEAVRRALDRNHDLLSARENIEAAAGRRNQALQRYLPGISGSLSYNRSIDNTFVREDGTIVTTNPSRYSAGASLSQTLIDWSAYKSIQAASRGLTANKYDYAQARADLVLATKQQYYALLRAQLLADVADSALVVSQQDLRRVESLFELGMVARGDVLKSKVRVSQSQLDVISNRNTVVIERSRLALFMGQEPSDDLSAARDVATTAAVIDSAQVFTEALANRPDLKAAEFSVSAANASVGAARAGYYPTLRAGLSYDHSDTALTVAGPRSRFASVSLGIPLFSSVLGTKGAIQQSQASANQARYALDRKRLDVEREVREAISAARQSNEGLVVAQDQVTSAEEDLKLSQEKYNVGSGTILELIDAQVALQRARSNYVQALTQVRTSEANLERVRGRTY
jgi:outer membrane protein